MLLNCDVGEDSWESLGLQEIQPVHTKGNQSWIFIGRTDAKAETLIFSPPDVKNWLIGKDPDAGKDWRQEKGKTMDEMVGWHHQVNGHEPEQALGVGDGQESLACCSPWGHKESDTTEWLNWTKSSFLITIRSSKKMCVMYILYMKVIWLIMFNFYTIWSVFFFYISFGEGNVKKC